jgi:hypothetical protein
MARFLHHLRLPSRLLVVAACCALLAWSAPAQAQQYGEDRGVDPKERTDVQVGESGDIRDRRQAARVSFERMDDDGDDLLAASEFTLAEGFEPYDVDGDGALNFYEYLYFRWDNRIGIDPDNFRSYSPLF